MVKIGVSDLLMRMSNGDFAIFDVSHDQVTGKFDIGGVDIDRQVVGFGNLTGSAGEPDMPMPCPFRPVAL